MGAPWIPRRTARRQGGAAALLVTMLLFFAMVLAVLFSNRTLLTEQRLATQDLRSAQAFEAAEAGLEWGLAALNVDLPIGADCRASAQPGRASFRARYLPGTPGDADRAGQAPVCIRDSHGWSCRCADPAAPTSGPGSDTGASTGPAFRLTLRPDGADGGVRLQATGCASAAPCLGIAPEAIDTTARLEVTLGPLSALAHPPQAAVTVGQGFDADAAAVGLHNPDAGSGWGVLAGGPIEARRARLTAPPGSATAGMLVAHDAALARLSPQQLFVSVFGIDKALWREQPQVVRLRCPQPCNGASLAGAAAASAGAALIWVDGDLALQGPLTLGSLAHPLALVVDGDAQLDGAVALTGVLYAGSLSWEHAGAAAGLLRGAAVAEGGYRGRGEPDFVYDPQVLAALQHEAGSYARVPGSWRER